MKPIIIMGNQVDKKRGMAKKKKKYKVTSIPLSPIEAVERLCRLIAVIDKVGDEMAAEAECVDQCEFDKILEDAIDQKTKLGLEYDRKLENLMRELKIFQSKKRRESNLALFAHQDRMYTGIVEEAKMRLGKEIGAGDTRFGKRHLAGILEDLFVQSVSRLNEPNIILYLRKRDFNLANGIISNCERRCRQIAGRNVNAELDTKSDLEGDDIRIVISNREGNIYIENNIFDKVERMANYVLVAFGPGKLFGRTY